MSLRRAASGGNMLERVTRLEEKIDALAPRAWVQDAFAPVNQTLTRLEQAIASLTDDSKALFHAHEQMLQERAEQQRQLFDEKLAAAKAEAKAFQERTLFNQLRDRWGPLATALSAIAGFVVILAGVFQWWLFAYVLKGH